MEDKGLLDKEGKKLPTPGRSSGDIKPRQAGRRRSFLLFGLFLIKKPECGDRYGRKERMPLRSWRIRSLGEALLPSSFMKKVKKRHSVLRLKMVKEQRGQERRLLRVVAPAAATTMAL